MDSVYYAYFEPYSWERHLELLDRAQMSEHVRMLDWKDWQLAVDSGYREAVRVLEAQQHEQQQPDNENLTLAG